ncbi:MAG: phasin family protein [Lysobacter sp.]|nr:phasin family protein [Lysobacter sp.]
MAKFKKSTKKSTAGNAGAQDQSARLSKTLSESASQIWLAGMGAFGRAQAEGNKLFEVLVKEGTSLEQSARKLAGGRADAVRDAVENRVSQTRERAVDTWDKLEKVFEDRVQRALTKLGVPGRDDLSALMDRVDTLNAQLRRVNGAPAPRKAARKAAPRTAARKAASSKAAKSTAKKTARKVARKTT